jgi:hypothetical protein
VNQVTTVSANKKRRKRPWTISARAKRMFHWSRLIHVYLSTLFLGLLIFFSITGLLINHNEWIKSPAKEGEFEKPIPAEIMANWSSYNWNEAAELPETKSILAFLKNSYGLVNPKEVKIDNEAHELTFDFQMASSYVFVTAMADEKSLRFEHREFGFWQVMGDLHKGRNSGANWSLLIDISAVAMILFSLTGLFILFQNMKQRRIGSILTLGGLVLPVLIYYFLVPRFFGV